MQNCPLCNICHMLEEESGTFPHGIVHLLALVFFLDDANANKKIQGTVKCP